MTKHSMSELKNLAFNASYPPWFVDAANNTKFFDFCYDPIIQKHCVVLSFVIVKGPKLGLVDTDVDIFLGRNRRFFLCC